MVLPAYGSLTTIFLVQGSARDPSVAHIGLRRLKSIHGTKEWPVSQRWETCGNTMVSNHLYLQDLPRKMSAIEVRVWCICFLFFFYFFSLSFQQLCPIHIYLDMRYLHTGLYLSTLEFEVDSTAASCFLLLVTCGLLIQNRRILLAKNT